MAAPPAIPDVRPRPGTAATPAASSRATQALARLYRLVGRNRLFSCALALGVLVRLLVMLAYWPAFLGYDSMQYLEAANQTKALPDRPVGYAFVLKIFSVFHSFALVAGLQHLLGLGVGVLVYVLLRRAGTGPRWATAGSLPVLINAHEVQLEHLVFSDTLFLFLLFSAVTLLLLRPSSWWVSGVAGLLLAAAALTRSVGVPLVLVALTYLLIRRVGWKALGAFAVCLSLPLAVYASWYHGQQGKFALTTSDGIFLYSRTTTFSDCSRIRPAPELQVLCVAAPPAKRPNPTFFIWHQSPLRNVSNPVFQPVTNNLALRFAKKAIISQPGDYASAVWTDFARSFTWTERTYPNDIVMREYSFRRHFEVREIQYPGARHYATAFEQGDPNAKVRPALARMVDGYARFARLRGPMLAALLVIALLGCCSVWRRTTTSARRWLQLLMTVTGFALLALPPALTTFDYRYLLPAIPFLSTSAALALSTWHQAMNGARFARRSTPSTRGAAGLEADRS